MLRKNNTDEKLISSIKSISENTAIERSVENKINEGFGIASKKSLPFELHEDYDALIKEMIAEVKAGKIQIDEVKKAAWDRFWAHDPETGARIKEFGDKKRAEAKAFKSAKAEIRREKKKELKEETQINEISKDLATRYARKAFDDLSGRYRKAVEKIKSPADLDSFDDEMEKVTKSKRMKYAIKATEKVMKEEEQLDELTGKGKLPKLRKKAIYAADKEFFKRTSTAAFKKAHAAADQAGALEYYSNKEGEAESRGNEYWLNKAKKAGDKKRKWAKKDLKEEEQLNEVEKDVMMKAVSDYDDRQWKLSKKNPRRHHNPYALSLYQDAVGRAHKDIKGGMSVADSINKHFNGQLARHLHKKLKTGDTDVDTKRRELFKEDQIEEEDRTVTLKNRIKKAKAEIKHNKNPSVSGHLYRQHFTKSVAKGTWNSRQAGWERVRDLSKAELDNRKKQKSLKLDEDLKEELQEGIELRLMEAYATGDMDHFNSVVDGLLDEEIEILSEQLADRYTVNTNRLGSFANKNIAPAAPVARKPMLPAPSNGPKTSFQQKNQSAVPVTNRARAFATPQLNPNRPTPSNRPAPAPFGGNMFTPDGQKKAIDSRNGIVNGKQVVPQAKPSAPQTAETKPETTNASPPLPTRPTAPPKPSVKAAPAPTVRKQQNRPTRTPDAGDNRIVNKGTSQERPEWAQNALFPMNEEAQPKHLKESLEDFLKKKYLKG